MSVQLDAGIALSDDQRAAWTHAWRLLPERAGSIQRGDRLLLPHLPGEGLWSLAEAEDAYDFSIDERSSDHGHVRSVRLLRDSIEPHAVSVSARLRETMHCRRALWNVDEHAAAVERLLEPRNEPEASAEQNPLHRAYEAGLAAFWDELRHSYRGAELERPVGALLGELFDEVEARGGRSEHGADFLCRRVGPLSERCTTAVQLKMWEGLVVDERALDQLREAERYWRGVTSCVLLTTAESVDPAFERARAALEDELGKPVEVICRPELLSLLLIHAAGTGARVQHGPRGSGTVPPAAPAAGIFGGAPQGSAR